VEGGGIGTTSGAPAVKSNLNRVAQVSTKRGKNEQSAKESPSENLSGKKNRGGKNGYDCRQGTKSIKLPKGRGLPEDQKTECARPKKSEEATKGERERRGRGIPQKNT